MTTLEKWMLGTAIVCLTSMLLTVTWIKLGVAYPTPIGSWTLTFISSFLAFVASLIVLVASSYGVFDDGEKRTDESQRP